MAVIVATKELIDCACLGAITIYTKAVQFGQFVITTVATVLYFYTVSLFHMHQPHQCVLPIVDIARVPTSRYESVSVGLQESFTE